VIINLIASTATEKGLSVQAELDSGIYPTGIKVSDEELAAVPLKPASFQGDWDLHDGRALALVVFYDQNVHRPTMCLVGFSTPEVHGGHTLVIVVFCDQNVYQLIIWHIGSFTPEIVVISILLHHQIPSVSAHDESSAKVWQRFGNRYQRIGGHRTVEEARTRLEAGFAAIGEACINASRKGKDLVEGAISTLRTMPYYLWRVDEGGESYVVEAVEQVVEGALVAGFFAGLLPLINSR